MTRFASTAITASILLLASGVAQSQVSFGPPETVFTFDTTTIDPTSFHVAVNGADELAFGYYNEVDTHCYFLQQTGSVWNDRVTVDGSDDAGKDISIAFDANDHAHLAWRNDSSSNEFPKYAFRANTNPTGSFSAAERIDSRHQTGNFLEMALDSNGVPHVTYRDEGQTNSGWYAKRNGTNNWTTERVVNDDRIRHSIAIDDQNRPHISWRDQSPEGLIHASRNGSWSEETVDTGTAAGNTTYIALEERDADRIGIAYGHPGEQRLKYATNRSGSWQLENIRTETNGRDTRGAFLLYDQNVAPHILHREDDDARTDNFIGYSEKTSGSWRTFDIDSGSVGGGFIIARTDGKLDIFYMKRINDTTKHLIRLRIVFEPTCDAGGPYAGNTGDTIQFSGTGIDPDGFIDTYDWDFGDGSVGTSAVPSHVYLDGGSYTVTLTVTDDDGAATSCATMCTINVAPTCAPGGPYSALATQSIVFDGSGSSDPDGVVAIYEWDFGDGNIGAGVSPSHSYANSGVFTITLCITDDSSSQSCCETMATIGAPPFCDAGAGVSGNVGAVVQFDGSASSDPDGSITSYAWQFGDGLTGGGVMPSHSYDTGGVYTVTLTVTDNGSLQSLCTTTATINALPLCDAAGPYNAETSETIQFDGSGSTDDGSLTAYDWDFGDGNSGAGVMATHAYTSAQLFTVTLCVTDNLGAQSCCTTTASVGDAPQPPLCDAAGPYTADLSATVQFDGSNSSDPDGSITTYAWDFGDGNSGAGVSATHAYTANGTFTVTLTVTDDEALSTSCSTTAAINHPPTCDADGTYSARPGQDITMDGSGSSDPDGSISTYAWDFGDGTSGTGVMPVHSYAAAGAFTVTLCVTDDSGTEVCCATTANIAENPPPICAHGGPYTGSVGDAIPMDASGSSDDGLISRYEWTFGDGGMTTGASPVHVYTQPGDFTITLCVTDNDDVEVCCATVATIADTTQVQSIGSVALIDDNDALSFVVTTSPDVQTMTGSFRLGGALGFQDLGTLTPTTVGDMLEWTVAFAPQNATSRGIEYFLSYQVDGSSRGFGTAGNPRRLTVSVSETGVALIERAYRMISPPVATSAASTIRSQLEPFFGAPGENTWRLGNWDAATQTYVPVENLSSSFEFGKAYWIIAASSPTWSVTGDSRFPSTSSGSFEIPLEPGWTMVGNPTGYRMTLDKSRLMIRDGASVQTFEVAAGGENPLVFSGIRVFDARSPNLYIEPPTIAKWNGCWVLNRTTRQLTLLVPAVEGTGARPEGPAAIATHASHSPSIEVPWRLTIDATSDDAHHQVELGMATAGRDGFDQFDSYAPPPVPTARMTMGLASPDAPGSGWRGELLDRDVRAIHSTTQTWQLEVSGDAPVELAWDAPLQTGAGGVEATLWIEFAGARHAMASLRSLTVPAGSHTVTIIASGVAAAGSPSVPGLWAVATPNPFRAGTTLTIGVPETGAVRVRVYDVAGRLVWSRDEQFDAGEHAIGWNGVDDTGRALSTGTYFVRVEHEANARPGVTEIALQKATLVR